MKEIIRNKRFISKHTRPFEWPLKYSLSTRSVLRAIIIYTRRSRHAQPVVEGANEQRKKHT